MFSKQFIASLDHLPEMLQLVEQAARSKAFSLNQLNQIIVSIEEALVNIILYSYPKEPGFIELTCQNAESEEGLQVIITDSGTPFDPLQAKHSNLQDLTNLDDIPLGGHGIPLFLKMMDEVKYERVNDQNRLTLTKYSYGSNERKTS